MLYNFRNLSPAGRHHHDNAPGSPDFSHGGLFREGLQQEPVGFQGDRRMKRMIIPVRLENRHRKQRRDFRECQRDLQVRIPAIIESGCQKLRTRLRKTGGNLEFYSSRVGALVECRFRKHRKEHTDWTQAIQELNRQNRQYDSGRMGKRFRQCWKNE